MKMNKSCKGSHLVRTLMKVTPPPPLRTAYRSILALRTAYRHFLTSRTAYRLTQKNNHFGRFH